MRARQAGHFARHANTTASFRGVKRLVFAVVLCESRLGIDGHRRWRSRGRASAARAAMSTPGGAAARRRPPAAGPRRGEQPAPPPGRLARSASGSGGDDGEQAEEQAPIGAARRAGAAPGATRRRRRRGRGASRPNPDPRQIEDRREERGDERHTDVERRLRAGSRRARAPGSGQRVGGDRGEGAGEARDRTPTTPT